MAVFEDGFQSYGSGFLRRIKTIKGFAAERSSKRHASAIEPASEASLMRPAFLSMMGSIKMCKLKPGSDPKGWSIWTLKLCPGTAWNPQASQPHGQVLSWP